MRIGHIELANRFFAAPMAGVTDRPFRQLCKRLGAGYAVSEMITSRRDLWASLKTSRRANHDGEVAPIAVQIAGTDAAMMAEAAAYNIDRGAQIIDINMGCPAKKVCNQWAGSALMQDEPLALAIVDAVVAACAPRNVPVTLKMRTGWCASERNALAIARTARKHIGWAVRGLPGGEAFRADMNRLDSCDAQVRAVADWFDRLADTYRLLPRSTATGAANDDFIEQQA